MTRIFSGRSSIIGITSIVSVYINSNDSFDLRHSLICTQILGNSLYRKFVVFYELIFWINNRKYSTFFLLINEWRRKKVVWIYQHRFCIVVIDDRLSLSLWIEVATGCREKIKKEKSIKISTITTFIVLSNKKHTLFSSCRKIWSIYIIHSSHKNPLTLNAVFSKKKICIIFYTLSSWQCLIFAVY
jgi:hypothetical protein